MNHIRTFLMAASCLALMIFASGCEKKQPTKEDAKKITSVRFYSRSITVVEKDNQTKLSILVNYKEYDTPRKLGLKFKSSDENLITIDEDGVINAKEAGDAKLSLLYQDGENICTDTIKVQIDLYFQTGINDYVTGIWDKNNDGHLSLQEAANVTHIGEQCKCHTKGDVKFKGMKDLDYVFLYYGGGIIDFSENPNLRRFYINPLYYYHDDDVPEKDIVEVEFNPNSPKLECIQIFTDERINHVKVSNYENCTALTVFQILSSCDMDIIDLSRCHQIAFLILPDFNGTLYLSPETFQLYTEHNWESEKRNFSDDYFVKVNPEANVVVKIQ